MFHRANLASVGFVLCVLVKGLVHLRGGWGCKTNERNDVADRDGDFVPIVCRLKYGNFDSVFCDDDFDGFIEEIFAGVHDGGAIVHKAKRSAVFDADLEVDHPLSRRRSDHFVK